MKKISERKLLFAHMYMCEQVFENRIPVEVHDKSDKLAPLVSSPPQPSDECIISLFRQ